MQSTYQTVCIPNKCKNAKLKPLFNKGSKTEAKSYRPISILPLISKVIERVVYDQTQSFLDKNEVICKYQSGFRFNHSPNSCLSYLSHKILTSFDKGMICMILIDLQKAFDIIDHKTLLQIMIYLRFSEPAIKWCT